MKERPFWPVRSCHKVNGDLAREVQSQDFGNEMRDLLVGHMVVARRSARLAIHQPVRAETHVDLRLAQHTKLLTMAI